MAGSRFLTFLSTWEPHVMLIKTGLLARESVRPSQRPVKLKVANGQDMLRGITKALLILDFIHCKELETTCSWSTHILGGSF